MALKFTGHRVNIAIVMAASLCTMKLVKHCTREGAETFYVYVCGLSKIIRKFWQTSQEKIDGRPLHFLLIFQESHHGGFWNQSSV